LNSQFMAPVPPRHSTRTPADRLPRLRDRIEPGVRALFVGINPGVRSALTGHHFAGYSNRFWKLLHEAGLVPEPIGYADDIRLPEWGYGITNFVARASPGIGDLRRSDYQAGRRRLIEKIRRFRPPVVALVGVTLYRMLFPRHATAGWRSAAAAPPASAELPEPLGLRPETLGGAEVFVLPNPSGRNANYSYEAMLCAFRALREHVDAGGTEL
jgi:double-stranded uracil-DNA glycosylase